MPSDLNSLLFVVALAIFGAGLRFLMPEHWLLGTVLTLTGVVGMLYAVRSLFLPKLIGWYKKTKLSSPYGTPVVVALLVVVTLISLFFGGKWRLIGEEAQLSVECDKQFFTVPQDNQPMPPRVTRFARIKVTNIAGKHVATVKAVVTRINEQEGWIFQLPPSSRDTYLIVPNPSLAVSVNMNAGDSQYFDAIIECNGNNAACGKGELAVPFIEEKARSFVTPLKGGSYSQIKEFTVRASGDGVSAVTKTCVIVHSRTGQLLMEEKSTE